MQVLLDTHCWLWCIAEPEKLSNRVREIALNSSNELFLSAASIWEISIKVSLGKLPLPEPSNEFIPHWLKVLNITTLNIRAEHALVVANMPFHHNDPFDRMLIAQSSIEKLPIVSIDAAFKNYNVEVIW